MTTLAGLRYRFSSAARTEFRWYWIGMLCYSFGMQSRAVIGGWLMYRLTGSALSLGYYIGTWGVAALVFSLFGGTISDRFGPRRVMIIARALAGAAILALLGLVVADALAVWHLLFLHFFDGIVSSFEYPARTAIVPRIIPRAELTGAFGLSYAAMNLASIIGPASVGFLIDHTGASSAILLTGTIMLLSALVVLPIRTGHSAVSGAGRQVSILSGLLDGLKYIRRERVLLALDAILLVYVILVMPFRDILPAVAADVLEVGASGLGLLSSAASVGAFLGTLVLSSLGEVRPRGSFLLGAAIVHSAGLVLFGQSRTLVLALLFLALAGLGHGLFLPLNNTLLQAYATAEMGARVIGMNMFIWALGPIGSIMVGALADHIGAGWAILANAAVAACLFILATLLSPRLRKLA